MLKGKKISVLLSSIRQAFSPTLKNHPVQEANDIDMIERPQVSSFFVLGRRTCFQYRPRANDFHRKNLSRNPVARFVHLSKRALANHNVESVGVFGVRINEISVNRRRGRELLQIL